MISIYSSQNWAIALPCARKKSVLATLSHSSSQELRPDITGCNMGYPKNQASEARAVKPSCLCLCRTSMYASRVLTNLVCFFLPVYSSETTQSLNSLSVGLLKSYFCRLTAQDTVGVQSLRMEPADVPNQKVVDTGCSMTLILTYGTKGLTLGLRVQLVDGPAYDNSFSHATQTCPQRWLEMMGQQGSPRSRALPGTSLCHFKGARITFHYKRH